MLGWLTVDRVTGPSMFRGEEPGVGGGGPGGTPPGRGANRGTLHPPREKGRTKGAGAAPGNNQGGHPSSSKKNHQKFPATGSHATCVRSGQAGPRHRRPPI